MRYAQSPHEISFSQRIAISLRKHANVTAKKYDSVLKQSIEEPVAIGQVLPKCKECTQGQKELYGCHKDGRTIRAKTRLRIDFPKENPSSFIEFCPKSYDDVQFDRQVLEVCQFIDKPKGIYPYFGVPIVSLWQRQFMFVSEVLAVRERLLADKRDKEKS